MQPLPPVVLGCGMFGGLGSSIAHRGHGETEEEAFALMDAAWALGLDWFDTADAYGGGASERWIGEWVAATGNHPRITTKTFNPMAAGADRGLARDRILRQIETSLERLGVDRVDLYLAHDFDPDVPVAETFAAFEQLRERGVVEAWGVSNFDAAQIRAALEHGCPVVVQNSLSLLDTRDLDELVPLCREHGILYQAYSPLAGGWLTGKYRRGEPLPEASRSALVPGLYGYAGDERAFDGLEALEREAGERGVSMAGLALAWVAATVDSAVVGPRRPEHLRPVEEAAATALPPEDAARLRSLFP